MSLFRKVVSSNAAQFARASRNVSVKTSVRSLSTVLETREIGEEAKYIRTMEAQRKAEMQAKIDRILALEVGAAERSNLEQLLADNKEEKKTSLLSDWKFAVPIAMFIGIPALSNEVLVLDAETQLVACFILFCSTMYTQVGGMMGKSLDDYGKEVAEDLKEVDNSILSQVNAAVEANQNALSLEEDYKQYCELTDQLAAAQADVLNQREAHLYREAIVKKLDSLQALEDSAVQAIRHRMLTKVKSDVVKTFTTDQKAKDLALTRAIEVLAGGAKAKLGKDVVGEVFAQSLASYRDAYSKQPQGSDPILKQLEKDMASVAEAPVVDSKGGNVFVTNPLL